jgi:hypothetical protein
LVETKEKNREKKKRKPRNKDKGKFNTIPSIYAKVKTDANIQCSLFLLLFVALSMDQNTAPM